SVFLAPSGSMPCRCLRRNPARGRPRQQPGWQGQPPSRKQCWWVREKRPGFWVRRASRLLYLRYLLLENSKLSESEIMAEAEFSKKDLEFLQQGAAQAAALLKAVANESRLLVLCLLIQKGEMSVGAMLEHIPLSQSALSQHLGRMREGGLVAFRRESQTLYYRIANPDVEKLFSTLKAIYCP